PATASSSLYSLTLHDALPISAGLAHRDGGGSRLVQPLPRPQRGVCPDPARRAAAGAVCRAAVHRSRDARRPGPDRGGPADHLRGAAAAALPLAVGGGRPALAGHHLRPDPDPGPRRPRPGRRRAPGACPPPDRGRHRQSLGQPPAAGPLAGRPGRPLEAAVAVTVSSGRPPAASVPAPWLRR